MKWNILKPETKGKKLSTDKIIDLLLENRDIKDKKEFFNSPHPKDLVLKQLGIQEKEVERAVERIKKAIKNKEKIIVYGDYDADGICATAILWEALHSLGANVLPHIPERFSEGYGLNSRSIRKLKTQHPNLGLIITVDNGIVAHEAIKTAKKLGMETIVTDHHQKGKKLPPTRMVVHTTQISGAALAWILARELGQTQRLELAAIGTIADSLSLIGANRSFAKHGLESLNQTERPGLLSILAEAGIRKGNLGVYHVSFIIAPRLNAMGRLAHGLDSLRLLCTKDPLRAQELAHRLGETNRERQKIVEEVVTHARSQVEQVEGVIFLAHESYHEGVIGIAASKLVEEHYRPAIVLARGEEFSKASARSIPGFNMIETIHQLDDLLEEGGGHPMAAGFTIRTERLDEFNRKFNQLAKPLLTEEILSKSLKIDCQLPFTAIDNSLLAKILKFAPFGVGNPAPTFVTLGVGVLKARTVGRQNSHLKLKLRQNGRIFDAIAFGFGNLSPKLSLGDQIDIVYTPEENVFNGNKSLELKIKDIKI